MKKHSDKEKYFKPMSESEKRKTVTVLESYEAALYKTIAILKKELAEEVDKNIALQKSNAVLIRDINAIDGTWEKKTERHLKELNEMRERWEPVLKACCNAEADVEALQERLEVANAELNDANDRINTLRGLREAEKVAETKKVAAIETRYATLVRDYDTLSKNNAHNKNLMDTYDKTMTDAKSIMDALREENRLLKETKVNDEHLARKVLDLKKSNDELVKENDAFKLQVTRLVNGINAHACPHRQEGGSPFSFKVPCGKCTACKLEGSYKVIESVSNELEKYKKREGDKDLVNNTTQVALDRTAKNLIETKAKLSEVTTEVSSLVGALDRKCKELELLKENRTIQLEASNILTQGLTACARASYFGQLKSREIAIATLKQMADFKASVKVV